ncbi:two pore calcium channel protein 1-like [Planococcus citri]|uniref:two pore calcium channel protein 1-like n=1 Tax=Planococcus citri TaxID=170843 RepID=UPI0031F9A3F5
MATVNKFGVLGDGYQRFSDDLMINPVHSADIEVQLDHERGNSTFNNRRISSFLNSSHVADTEIELNNPNEYVEDDSNMEMIYHEAAIFLEEGKNNEKFDSHPHESEALPPYLLVHNTWYYSLDLFTSIVLLALALGEDPAVQAFKMPVFLHAFIELVALVIIGIELGMKLRWIGWLTILKHKRTMIKGVTLTVMLLEVFVVLFRQTAHFRVTRALRPIFLVDTHHLGGVRRFIRQILQSLPPIIDMLMLILFFVALFSILGFFLFCTNNHNFATLYDSFVSMFVLLTTANFPDVMMPSYAESRWFSLFFISYLCIVLYLLMNLMLAVVYETFTTIEKEKMKKLYLHKHKGCNLAYDLLVSKNNAKQLRFKLFQGLMRYFAPKKSDRDVVIIFKYLNSCNTGILTKDEFNKIYDAVILRWEPQYANIPWYHSAWMPLQNVCQMAHTIISLRYFEYFFYIITFMNGLTMANRALYQFDIENLDDSAVAFSASWDTVFFSILFGIEVAMKMLGLGTKQFFNSGWNTFDFIATLLPILGLFILNVWPHSYYVVLFRPLKMFRLFKMKKRYRDIIGTVALLSPLIKSAFIVMIVVYYFFAIIGMELFARYDMRDCCKGTVVEDFYQYKLTPNGTTLGYYYLNTFSNIAVSAVTLFELTVVNNWFIVMNGYAAVVHPITRIYFIMFYLFTMIVLTIVVASILEAFRFRIQYKRQTSKRDEEKMLHEEVDLKWEEIMSWIQDFQLLEKLRPELVVGGTTTFIGSRPRSREVLQSRMYRNEIETWLRDASAAREAN